MRPTKQNAFSMYSGGAGGSGATTKPKKGKTPKPTTMPNKKPTMTPMPPRNSYETAQQRREREAGL